MTPKCKTCKKNLNCIEQNACILNDYCNYAPLVSGKGEMKVEDLVPIESLENELKTANAVVSYLKKFGYMNVQRDKEYLLNMEAELVFKKLEEASGALMRMRHHILEDYREMKDV